jgi:hypothetical protein
MVPHWVFGLVFCGSALPGAGQSLAPGSFRPVPVPAVGSAAWSRLTDAPGYAVKNVAGKLVITKASEPHDAVLKTPAGTFLGRDRGEWGGELLFQPLASKAQPRQIKAGNVRFVFQLQQQVYFLESLAHLDISRGALYRITGPPPAFTYTKLLDFADAPEAVAVVGNDLFIAQLQGFTVVSNGQTNVLLEKAFWAGLYPNSVAVLPGNQVYIGLRGGYAQLERVST